MVSHVTLINTCYDGLTSIYKNQSAAGEACTMLFLYWQKVSP